MNPQLIKTGNDCRACDGYGIMSLYGGPNNSIIAPCIECSPTKNLNDLLNQRNQAIAAFEKAKELKEIDEHNKRIRGGT